MTTRWRQKASSILVLVLMAFLLIVIIFLWTAVSNGVFTSNRSTINNKINISENRIIQSSSDWKKEKNKYESTISPILPSTISTTLLSSTSSSLSSSSENLESTKPPDIGIGQSLATNAGLEDIENIEYIKPSKIHVQPLHEEDLLYESKKIDPSGIGTELPERYHHHITGHFRNKSSRIWDPHPQYEIDAFGLHLHLILYHDADFITKDIKVTHVWPNETLRLNEDAKDLEKLQGCFYKGHVRGDEKSTVTVSLCDGMRGHIRTSSGSFFIQPVEKYTNENTNILHAVYRVPTLPGIYALAPLTSSSSQGSSSSSNEKDYDWSKRESSDKTDTIGTTFINNNHIRNKRSNPSSVNNAYTMEVLVAVDKKMQEYHGDAINSYVLTLMSLVSSIYADASIGNSINVAVVHVLHLKHDFNLHSHRNGVSASTMLVEFCKLKQQFNFPHDTALLLTREQICRNENQTKCDTLGLAELGTMCNSYSCSIVQENGLSAAFTMAHELGHVLNMPHDDDPKCDKYREIGQTKQNIMSRMLDHNTYPWSWSNCSRHFVTEFLEKDRGKCMLNKPEHDLIQPTWPNSKLAGEKFTKDEQCELVFGPNSKICSYMPVCNRLWCSEDDRENSEGCRTQHMPWADGTACGINRWCQKGECINRNRTALKPIDGAWGHWSRYGECSRPCGGGVHESTRACDSPAPANGGKYCIGYRIKYRSCNTEQCPSDKLDFREEQCTEQDNNNFDIPGLEKNVKWVPKYGVAPPDECKLFCRVYKSHSYFVLKDKVKDGTPCSHDSFNKCVNGVCRPAGCDNELDSTAKLDKCGVCKGRNETCLDVTGSFSYSQIVREENKAAHYYRVVKIPKGSSNLDIRQPGYGKDNNYIALMDDQGQYMLNGKNLITSYPITFPYAGVIFYYTGANNTMERVNTTYAIRLKRDMFVMILSLHPMERYNNDEFVKFSYTISRQEYEKPLKTEHERQSYGATRKIHYQWKMSEWSECNILCMGQKFQKAACIQMDVGLKVSPNFCHPHPKPADEYKTCNTECELNWEMSRNECSNPCGEGESETKYNCIQTFLHTRHSNIVDASYCPSSRPPSTIEKCYGECEDATWVYGDWEPCSHTCGSGHQNRSVVCHSSINGFPIDQNFCMNIKKEYAQKLCNPEPCPEWAYGVDTPCSVTCGEGKSTTAIVCKQNNVIVNAALCGHIPRPLTNVKNCTMEPCNKKKIERFDKDAGLKTQHFVDNNDVIHTRSNNIYSMSIPHNPIKNYVPASTYEWRTGRWGICSISCGSGGMKTRSVRCTNKTSIDNRYVEDYYCDSIAKPVNVANCTEASCLDWTVGEWGECNISTCKRQRSVKCQNNITGKIDSSLCRSESIPNVIEACCHYKWRTKLSACSGPCGAGERTRRQSCMRLKPKNKDNPNPVKTGEILPDYYCKHLKRGQIKVYKEICKAPCFRWETGPWSECSVGCGSGGITRKVTCTNGKEVSSNITVDCDMKTKPANYQKCENKNHCKWRAGKWKNCNCYGVMKRRVVCIDGISKLRSNLCTDHDKPKTKVKCLAPSNCSCRKLKEKKGYRRDGEYFLNIRGKNISIYCHNMSNQNPMEYLTLAAGPQQNYASYYSRRAKDPTVCPSVTRADEWEEASLPHGTTSFNKIRIILPSLQVIEDDFTFADTGGQSKSFASAGDCYSKTEQCPQGAFSINLDGTGFQIHPRTLWETKGPNSTIIFIDRLHPPYTKVTARCGGYCGSCFPSKKTNLYLETFGVN